MKTARERAEEYADRQSMIPTDEWFDRELCIDDFRAGFQAALEAVLLEARNIVDESMKQTTRLRQPDMRAAQLFERLRLWVEELGK